ncbi:MAG TPA: response regulator [Pirellulales bacterium]|jgi:FixJ family two-component response regulator|nr:response regulator [Pirellulales bacterium]
MMFTSICSGPAAPSKEAVVFIIDDDGDLRQVIATLVRSAKLATQTFASAREFLATFNDAQCGCVVVDEKMPGMTGLELQQRLSERGSIIPMIFVSGDSGVSTAATAMRAGAVDFIAKPFCCQHLLERIQEALALGRERGRVLQRDEQWRSRAATLTAREREVMQCLARGETTKAIAHRLGISRKTVINHQTKVLEKMSAENAAQLAAAFHELSEDESSLGGGSVPGNASRSEPLQETEGNEKRLQRERLPYGASPQCVKNRGTHGKRRAN